MVLTNRKDSPLLSELQKTRFSLAAVKKMR